VHIDARKTREANVREQRDTVQDSSQDDIFATASLKSATEQVHQASWHTEPDTGLACREQLTRSLATIPDISHDVYPFKGMKLNHADVEHPALLRKVR